MLKNKVKLGDIFVTGLNVRGKFLLLYGGCSYHWFKLPSELRTKIWSTYRPGQEIDLKPSESYLQVARAVQDWIKEKGNK